MEVKRRNITPNLRIMQFFGAILKFLHKSYVISTGTTAKTLKPIKTNYQLQQGDIQANQTVKS